MVDDAEPVTDFATHKNTMEGFHRRYMAGNKACRLWANMVRQLKPVMIAAGTLGAIAYVVGRTDFTEYLGVQFVPGTGELAIFAAALIGGGLGFLWYNAPPAAVFMGDTGSLALGGALGAIAVCTQHEIVLGIVGGLFVVEALSVIIQVAYFKRTGKRVFLMAPIHHHFEKKGWSEPQIVIRFWIISLILALIGLATLKIR